MGIISYLVILLTFYSVSLLLLPFLFRIISKFLLKAKSAHLKLKTPFTIKGIFLHFQELIWGVQSVIVYIPEVHFSFELSKFRMVVRIKKPKIMLMKDVEELTPVRMIDGMQEHNLLLNLITIVKKTKKKEKKRENEKQYKSQSRFKTAFKIATNFFIMMAMQFIKIQIQESAIILASHVDKKSLKFQNLKDIVSSFLLMECLHEVQCNIPSFVIKASIKNNYEWAINLSCPFLTVITTKHMEDNLIESHGLDISVALPLTFSLLESLTRVRIQYSLEKIIFNTVPSDIENMSLIFNSLFFDPFKENSAEVQTSEKQKNSQIIINIDQVELKLRELYEPNFDEKGTADSLSNISQASLIFQSVHLNESGFQIDKTTLQTEKFFNGLSMKEEKVLLNQVFKLNNLFIHKDSKKYEIGHDDVKIYCQRQEIALFGKLFRIINSRIRRQQFDSSFYHNFYDLAKRFIEGKIRLEEIIVQYSQSCFSPQESKKFEERVITYNPKHIQFEVDISQLVHKINLHSINYHQRQSNRTNQISHELSFNRIYMQYKGIKEFHVNEFKLFYKQSRTDNELSIFVDDIHMVQNFNTLKDYLIGFTIFKQLLEFSNDEVSEQPHKTGKNRKKLISVNKIMLNYMSQVLILRKLFVDKFVTSNGFLGQLYFSLGKCDFIVDKIVQPNKLFKYNINPSHSILIIEAITMKTNLIDHHHTKKEKSFIRVKNPTFLLPQIDISSRLVNYIKTYYDLKPYLEAYLKNVTNQKLKNFYKNSNIFLNQPDFYIIKINNILIGMQDTYFDKSLLNKMRTMDYANRSRQNYNENQFCTSIKQSIKHFNLCELNINSISVEVSPIKQLDGPEAVEKWIKNLTKSNENSSRLIKVGNYDVGFQIRKINYNIRDYPFEIFGLDFFNGNLKYLQTKNIYEEVRHNIKGGISIGNASLCTGLCLLSGYLQIFKRVNKFNKAVEAYQNTAEFLQSVKQKKQIKKSKYKPYWHILHKSAFWDVKLEKSTQTVVKVLTSLTPYITNQFLNVKFGSFILASHPTKTSLILNHFIFYHQRWKIFQLAEQIITLQTVYDEPDLSLHFSTEIKADQRMANQLIIRDELIRYISSFKQFRRDWLLIYGLVEQNKKDYQNAQKKKLNYLQLATMAANKKLKTKQTELSIFTVLKYVQFKCFVNEFVVEFFNCENQISLILDKFTWNFQTIPRNTTWKMEGFYLKLSTILGRLRLVNGRQYTTLRNKQFLTQFRNNNFQSITVKKNYKKNYHEVFMVCRDLKFKLHQYQVLKNQVYYVHKKLFFESIKIEIEKQLKFAIDSIYRSFTQESTQENDQQAMQKSKLSPLQRFRQAVFIVIRINRRKKRLSKNFKTLILVKKIQLALKSQTMMVLLGSQSSSYLAYRLEYFPYDKYHIDPLTSINVEFPDLSLWVRENRNPEWILEKDYSPATYFQINKMLNSDSFLIEYRNHQNDTLPEEYSESMKNKKFDRLATTTMTFNNGVFNVYPQTITTLKQLINLIVILFSSKQKKEKEIKFHKQKDEDMRKKGKEVIKNSLMWSFSDMRKKGKPQLASKVSFMLNKMNIHLQRKLIPDPFVKIQSNQISFQLAMFSNGNIQKQFHITNLTVFNLMEKIGNPYYEMIQMNHEESLAIFFTLEECDLSEFWSFTRLIHIHLNPIKIRVTEQIYTQIYAFLFGENPQEKQQIEEQNSQVFPDYYLQIVIDEVNVQAWYRTESRLKRLDGVSMGLERYELSEQLLTKKNLFDKWIKFVLKQAASQFFNVLSQKLFG